MKTRLIIVDISSFIFRAFFAIRLLHAPDGTPVNAVRGVLSMLLKLLSKYQPTHIMLAKDIRKKLIAFYFILNDFIIIHGDAILDFRKPFDIWRRNPGALCLCRFLVIRRATDYGKNQESKEKRG